MMHPKQIVTLVGLGLVLASTPKAQDKLPPTEILHLMFREMTKNPDAQRTTLTLPLMKRAQTDGLSERERFALGEVYFTNLQPVESKAAFEPFMSGTDARAAMAWERVMQILFRAEGKADEVERMLPHYRKRFPPSPDNVYGAVFQVSNLANVYKDEGEHAKVVELIEAEVSTLSFDAPYRAWLLPGTFFDSYEAVGQADKARKYLTDAHAHYLEELEGSRSVSPSFVNLEHVDGVLHRIEDQLFGSLIESDDPHQLRALRTKSLVEALDKRIAETRR